MAEITAAMVKELRERTGLGMMECKKALTAAGGDIREGHRRHARCRCDQGCQEGRQHCRRRLDRRQDRCRQQGRRDHRSQLQTDFLALQDDFKGFVAESLEKAFNEKLTDAAPLVEAREEARLALVAKTGENVNIRRLTRVEGDVVGAYLHGHRIGVVVNLKGGNPELAKDIAMHVAASNPQFLSASEVSEEAIAKEKEIFLALNADKIAGKPENIVENMVKGRISKFLAEASLVEQPFVKNPEVKVGDLAKQAGAEIVSFVRYEVGEGIEKAEVDFAAEVAAQVAATKQ